MEEYAFHLNEENFMIENDLFFNIENIISKDETLSMGNNSHGIKKEKERNKKIIKRYNLKSEAEKNILRKKNAISAKKFRIKKKEKEKTLFEENESLKFKIEFLKKKISSLKSIISNYDFINSKFYIDNFDSN